MDFLTLIRLSAVLAVAYIVFVTISPARYRPQTKTPASCERAAAFSGTVLLLVLSFPSDPFLAAFLAVVAAGASEYLQKLSPSRHADARHAFAKAAGGALGAVVAILLLAATDGWASAVVR
jgi:hypothetical protein